MIPNQIIVLRSMKYIFSQKGMQTVGPKVSIDCIDM
jgi:hypothetical protein